MRRSWREQDRGSSTLASFLLITALRPLLLCPACGGPRQHKHAGGHRDAALLCSPASLEPAALVRWKRDLSLFPSSSTPPTQAGGWEQPVLFIVGAFGTPRRLPAALVEDMKADSVLNTGM
ncbi:hypothetical protein MHYP_G00070290 [Metynnis hypsauchen]